MQANEYTEAVAAFAADNPGPLDDDERLGKLKAILADLRENGSDTIDDPECRKLIHLCADAGFAVGLTAWLWYSGRTVTRWGFPVRLTGPPRGYSDLSPDGSRINFPYLHRYRPKSEWLEEGEYIIIKQGDVFRRFKAYPDKPAPQLIGIEPVIPEGANSDVDDGPDSASTDDTASEVGSVSTDASGPASPPPAPVRRSTRQSRPPPRFTPAPDGGSVSTDASGPASPPPRPVRRSTRVSRPPPRFNFAPDGGGGANRGRSRGSTNSTNARTGRGRGSSATAEASPPPYNPAEPPAPAIEAAQSIASRLSRVRKAPSRFSPGS